MPHAGISPAAGYQLLQAAGCVRACSDTTLMSTYHDDWMMVCLSYTPQGAIHAQMYPWTGCVNPFGIDDPPSPLPPLPPPPPPPIAPPPAGATTIIIIVAAAVAALVLAMGVLFFMCRKSTKAKPNFRGAEKPTGDGVEVAGGAYGGAKMPGGIPA